VLARFGNHDPGFVHLVFRGLLDVVFADRATISRERFDGFEIETAGEILAAFVLVVQPFQFEDLALAAMRARDEEAMLRAAAVAADELGGFEVRLRDDADEGIVGRGEAGAEMVDDVGAIEHARLSALGDHVFHVVEEAVAQGLLGEQARRCRSRRIRGSYSPAR
jgi:hypothetical protein